MNYILSFDQSKALIRLLSQQLTKQLEIDTVKHQLLIRNDQGQTVFTFKLPWCLPPIPKIQEEMTAIAHPSAVDTAGIIILIQAGHASLGISECGKIREHKVIQKYMVRKKQGKAQITYLNQKGKSRAGSRIRLAETVEFFEEINDRLNSWMKTYEIHRIMISCSERLWGMIFQSRIKAPFQKKDDRLLKLPVHVHKPTFAELKRINYLSQEGYVKVLEEFNPSILSEFFNELEINQ